LANGNRRHHIRVAIRRNLVLRITTTKGRIMPNTRTLDPQTSHEAEASVTGLAETYRIILATLRQSGPMNDQALIRAFQSSGKRASDSGIRSRRSELTAQGLIVDTGDRVKMESGRMSIVWGVA
jgi:hypothetical protein